MTYTKFDPTKQFFKSITGAVCQNEKFAIRLQIHECVKPSKVFLHIFSDDGEFFEATEMVFSSNDDGFDSFLATVSLNKGLYWYYFKMEGVPYEEFVGLGEDFNAQLFFQDVKPWQLSVYKQNFQTPRWLNNGIMYQIFVDRFFGKGKATADGDKILRVWGEQPFFKEPDGSVKNRDFFGGNLAGILEKLPYLVSLNVKTIYLSPIFSAYSNHKYDVEDYETIDKMFGTLADFENLSKEAKKLGIKIILDGVFNHVGSTSKYFNRGKKYGEGGAFNDKNSPYYSWFNFKSDSEYECWWDFLTLPRLNAKNEDVKKYFCDKDGIVPYWLKKGASGWRLDVVDEIDDFLLDEIVTSAKNQLPDCAMIGEVWEDASNKIAYGKRRRYFEGQQLDSVMNYPLRHAIVDFVRDGNTFTMKKTVFGIVNNYPLHIRNNLMNILGTHDTARILTVLAGENLENCDKEKMSRTHLSESQYRTGVELLKLCAVLQFTMFGFPCVFYGDEAGIEGYKDPFCRACFPWGHENKILLDFYKQLSKLRDFAVFKDGDFNSLVCENGVFAFLRTEPESKQKAVVAVNRSQQNFVLDLDGNYTDFLTGRIHSGKIDIQTDQAMVLLHMEVEKDK